MEVTPDTEKEETVMEQNSSINASVCAYCGGTMDPLRHVCSACGKQEDPTGLGGAVKWYDLKAYSFFLAAAYLVFGALTGRVGFSLLRTHWRLAEQVSVWGVVLSVVGLLLAVLAAITFFSARRSYVAVMQHGVKAALVSFPGRLQRFQFLFRDVTEITFVPRSFRNAAYLRVTTEEKIFRIRQLDERKLKEIHAFLLSDKLPADTSE